MRGDQTDTPAFKNWFGDWQQAAQAQRLTHGAPVATLQGSDVSAQTGSDAASIKQMRADARAWGKTIITKPGQPYTNLDTGLQVEVRPRGVREALSHGSAPDKIRALEALPALLRDGVAVFDGINPKNSKQRLLAFAAKVRIAGADFIVTAGVREDISRLFYDHELMVMESADRFLSKSGPQGWDNKPSLTRNTVPAALHFNGMTRRFIMQASQARASKVVDADAVKASNEVEYM